MCTVTQNLFLEPRCMVSPLSCVVQRSRSPVISQRDRDALRPENSNSSSAGRAGRCSKFETQLQIARELDYLRLEHCTLLLQQCSEVGKILNGLIAALPRSR